MSEVDKSSIQSLCDFAVKKMVQQGQRCMGIYGSTDKMACKYTDGENHCAVGWLGTLFPELGEQLDKHEGHPVSDVVFENEDAMPEIIVKHVNALGILQEFHDEPWFWAREEARDELNDYGINTDGGHWNEWIEMVREDDE